MKKVIALFAVLAFHFSCSTVQRENGDAWKRKLQNPAYIHDSMKKITDIIVHDIFSPPVASRIYTYSSVAAYEAIIHEDQQFISLAGQLNGLEPVPTPEEGEEYSFTVAAVHAMLKVGRQLIFSEEKLDVFYDSLMGDFQRSGIPRDVFERSIRYGTDVANHIIKWSSTDNYKQSRSFPKYTILDDPGTWRPTPPAYMEAVEPHWNKIRTFAIDSAAQFKPAPPTPFSTNAQSQFYKEAYEVYAIGKGLTEEQREIASFWDCNPFVMNVKGHVMFATKKISPGGHWMNITRVACEKEKTSAVRAAEAYAMVSIALFDGFVSCWDEKYRSKLIRPETYINQYIDDAWTPLLQTPPFPEYSSGHSVISSAAAVTLTALFGDNFAFVDSTEVEFGLPPRSFTSFLQASEEAAVSRIYGGIHYRPACDLGVVQGRALGHYVVDKIQTRRMELANK